MKSSNCNLKRRIAAKHAVMLVAVTAASSSIAPAAAFTVVDTPFSSISISSTAAAAGRSHHALARASPSTASKLWASKSDADASEKKKLTIETIVDDNRHTLLQPPDAPDRPILVDAFAPWCGPCKLLDKALRKSQPRYVDKVNFCRWNVNDKENTVELKQLFLDSGFTLNKLPSLILFREGKPVAVRPGFANEFQLDYWLEENLDDVLEKTFDENGVKMIPLPEEMMKKIEEKVKVEAEQTEEKESKVAATTAPLASKEYNKIEQVLEEGKDQEEAPTSDCTDEVECWERIEQSFWQNRTVVPAMDGILLPARSMSP